MCAEKIDITLRTIDLLYFLLICNL